MKSAVLVAALLVLATLPAAATTPGWAAIARQPSASSSNRSAASPPASSALEPAGRSGRQPFMTLLCKFADAEDEPIAQGYFDGLFGATYPGLGDYWREVSYGRISLAGSRPAGWYTLPRPQSAYRSAGRGEIALDLLLKDCVAAADADVYFPDFVGINLVFNRALDNAARGGQVWLLVDGQALRYGVTWLWPHLFEEHGVVAHEIGHAFGLSHSAAGRDKIYGSPWDVMSGSSACAPDATYGAQAPHVIAYAKDLLGWLPANKKWVAGPHDTATIELAALADATAPGYWLAQVPVAGGSGRFYTVEARRRIGYDRSLPADAVLIHEVDPQRDPPAVLMNLGGDRDTRDSVGMWAPGAVFVDPLGGVAVAVDRATATGFVVTLATGVRPWPISPVRAQTVSAGQVAFTWQPVAGASGYLLRVVAEPPSPADPVARGVIAASATIALPPGHYRWQVRALPDGEWTPTVGLVTGFAGRRWQPSEIVATFVSRSPPRLAITAQPNREVTIAWAAESGVCGAWVGRPLSTDAQPARGSNWEEEQLGSDCRRLASARPGWPTEAALALQTMPGAISATAWAGEWEMGGWTHRDAAVAVDAFGNAQVVWVAESDASILAATRQANGEWDIPIHVSGASTDIHANPAVALDSRGAVYAAWQRQAGCSHEAASADIEFTWRPAGGDWQPASVVSRDIGGISLSAPALAVGADGAAYLVWEELIAGRYVLFSSYRPAGGAWEEKMVFPDAAAGYWEPTEPALAVDSAGNAYVTWLEQRDDLVAVRISASVE